MSVALQVFKSCAPEECEAEYEAIGSGTYAVSLIGFGYFGTQAWLAVDVEESAAELQGVAAPYGDGARMAGTILYRVESIERAVDVRDSEHGSSFPPGFQAPPGPTWDTSGEETQ